MPPSPTILSAANAPEAHAALAPMPGLLKGSICPQYVRCGNRKCCCQSGQLHGPYYYRVWREGKRVYKVYVPPSQYEEVAAACEAYKQLQLRLKHIRQDHSQVERAIGRQRRRARRLMAASPAGA